MEAVDSTPSPRENPWVHRNKRKIYRNRVMAFDAVLDFLALSSSVHGYPLRASKGPC